MNGATTDDDVVTPKNAGNGCYKIATARANSANNICIICRIDSGAIQSLGVGEVSVIVYKM